MNYYISYEHRHSIIEELIRKFFQNEGITKGLYMTLEHLKEMKASGMVIGSHGNNHPVYSKLTAREQETEIKGSFDFLEKAIGPLAPKSFCYPYSIHSCTPIAERILDQEGCLFSFSLENRSITRDDLILRPQALPRHACHLLPYGKAHIGSQPPQY